MNNLRKFITQFKVKRFNKRKAKVEKNISSNKFTTRPLVVLLVLLFIFILITLQVVASKQVPGLEELEIILSGCFFAFLLLIAALIVVTSHGHNFLIAIILQIVELSFIGVQLLANDSWQLMPGFFISISGIILCYILKVYLGRIQRSRDSLDKATYMDNLTGCNNRKGLIKLLDDRVAADRPFYLVCLDLDNFKSINDTLGHDTGDDLLRFVANKWSNIASYDKCTLARLNGDVFAVIIDTGSQKIAKAVTDEMMKCIQEDGVTESYTTVSVGLASYPSDTRDPQKLLSYADTAMVKAKVAGKNRSMFFDAEMYKEIVNRYNVEKDIQKALDSNNFILAYQPQFNIKDHSLVGFEVLLRMKTEKGLVYPKNFIEIAEKSGLIYNVDLWVLKHALVEAEPIMKANPNLTISLNISGKHLSDSNLITETLDALDNAKINATNLVIEIKESTYIRHLEDAIHNINKLRLMGCQISLDDFGTGYSSLSHLSKIPVNSVKISKAFIDNIDSADNASGVQFLNIISMLGHLLGCKVIVEGVERETQLNEIKKLDVDVIQGYIWGKPLELEEALSII